LVLASPAKVAKYQGKRIYCEILPVMTGGLKQMGTKTNSRGTAGVESDKGNKHPVAIGRKFKGLRPQGMIP
jgi:hypothetical protein